MSAIDKLASLLGEDNIEQMKSEICKILIEIIKDDLDSYLHSNYITNWDFMGDFIQECQKEAFNNVKKEVISKLEDKIRKAVE